MNKKRTPWLIAAGIVVICAGVGIGMMLKPDAQSGWEMTMKLTLIQNETTPVELVDNDEIKVWCEGSKKALESMGMEVPVTARADAWEYPKDVPLTAARHADGHVVVRPEIWRNPDSVTCFMPEDRVLVRLTPDQLLQAAPLC